MKKVVLIHNNYLSARNGANTVMRSLLDSKSLFANYGIEIGSLTPDSFVPRSFEPNSSDAVMNSRRAKAKKWLKTFAQHSRLAADMMMYLSEFRSAQRIASFYVNSDPSKDEIVFFHSLVPCYYYLKLRKQYQKTILVCHTNGDNFKMDRMYYRALEKSCAYKKMLKMEQFVIDHVDRINFVAEMARENFLTLHPEIDNKKVSFIYNGVPDNPDLRHIKKEKDLIEICCVASISNRKGQHYIIEALKSLPKKDMPKVHFTFVGDGPDRDNLENVVKNSDLMDYVSFVGISYDVDKYLEVSDAYILPSEDEGLPMAIIEAMRSSLPIISTRVGGIPEMIDHERNGLLIDPAVEDIRELLLHINEYDWCEMGKNARLTFEKKFSVFKMVEKYANLLLS